MEVPELHERVTPERASLAADRSRIAEIEAQIHALRAEQQLVQDRLDAYTYPVLTLPPEIIAEVFIHFLPAYPRHPPRAGLLSPLTLGQICRTWREIALLTPKLWRAVSILLPSRTRREQLHVAELMLARSGSSLLTASITSYFVGAERAFIGLIAPHCERLEHLQLCASELSGLDSVKTNLSSLRTLMVGLSTIGFNDPGPGIFLTAPLLRKVALKAYTSIWLPILPWSQLSVLSLDYIRIQECATVLNIATNIVFCRLAVESRGNMERPPIAPLRHLETLVLRVHLALDPNVNVEGLCSTLTLPALRELQVAEVFLLPDPTANLGQLLSRSGCSPAKIHIMDSEQPLEVYCQAIPSVAFHQGPQRLIHHIRPQGPNKELPDIGEVESLDWRNEDVEFEDSGPWWDHEDLEDDDS
ncbi:hypothetical protein B0H16DRAFT_1700873 [Mycena metata]|uniref:F-box domain-containing protein n=1 Tax=Mycena metata TaxID=1033252 RepID=A0AAD7HDG2_9AGAR|nr:hypothetical protein B0H16DRAFT_1700873 [Mycena metata]